MKSFNSRNNLDELCAEEELCETNEDRKEVQSETGMYSRK